MGVKGKLYELKVKRNGSVSEINVFALNHSSL